MVKKDFGGGESLSPSLTSDASGKYVVLGGFYDNPVKIFYSSDFGVTWAAATPDSGYYGLDRNSLTSGYTGQYAAVASGAGLYQSSDYGATWAIDSAAPSTSLVSYKSLVGNNNFTVLYLLTSAGLYVGTNAPTRAPSLRPSSPPSVSPTFRPPSTPSFSPTSAPSVSPTFIPSKAPSVSPTFRPSSTPSFSPTSAPSVSPTFTHTYLPSISYQPTAELRGKGGSDSNATVSDGGIAGIVIACVVVVAAVAVLAYVLLFRADYQSPDGEGKIEVQMS
jgi:hypothetical protein